MNIAANIAKLRRERGMTQEALAEVIGVSSQTISKWENSTTWPDVALLPVIADVFGVTIDALYGRERDYPNVSAATAVDAAIEAMRETIVAMIHVPELDGTFGEHLAQYKKAMEYDKQRSVIENDRDVLYFREKLGALALRKPENGWSSLFNQAENLDILRLLADEDFRRAMQVIISRRMLTFTLPSLAKEAGVQDANRLEVMLQISGLFARRELMIDESPLVYYELTQGETKLYLLYAVLAFAQELRTYESIHYCFIGNSSYFTP
ncbi:MAG: helix-turn-helix transcriptional regulator [Clostridia bacterium]|nr:helix-turn-helix transcriptional regulator [Clostridia bacterium]